MNQNEKSTPGGKRTQEGVAGTPSPTGRSRCAPGLRPESRLEGRAVLPPSGPGARAPGAALRAAWRPRSRHLAGRQGRRRRDPKADGKKQRRELTSRRRRRRGHGAAGARPAGLSGARLPGPSSGAGGSPRAALGARSPSIQKKPPPPPHFQPRLSVAE